MFTQTRLRQIFLAPSLMLVLISGLFVSTPQAHAQANREAMLAQIQQLLTLITSLQQQLLQMNNGAPAAGTPRSDVALKIGSKVQVVNARSGPSLNASRVYLTYPYAQGQIVDGPRYADGLIWWLVRYYSGTQAWSIGSKLRPIDTTSSSQESTTEDHKKELSIEIVSPREETYTYGDPLIVEWRQMGSAPAGSVACADLDNSSTGMSFTFPSMSWDPCVDVSGYQPNRRMFGEIKRTSGYNLAPGKYQLNVVILGPNPDTGADRETLAKDSTTIKISKNDEVITNKAMITSVSVGENPVIKGTAAGNGYLTLLIQGAHDDFEAYSTDKIKVKNGTWSHKVNLEVSTYIASLYMDYEEVDKKIFETYY